MLIALYWQNDPPVASLASSSLVCCVSKSLAIVKGDMLAWRVLFSQFKQNGWRHVDSGHLFIQWMYGDLLCLSFVVLLRFEFFSNWRFPICWNFSSVKLKSGHMVQNCNLSLQQNPGHLSLRNFNFDLTIPSGGNIIRLTPQLFPLSFLYTVIIKHLQGRPGDLHVVSMRGKD